MIKYILFNIIAVVVLVHLYVFQAVIINCYPLPSFELFAPLLFAVAGLPFLHNKTEAGAISSILALGIIAKETIGLWSVLRPALQTKFACQIVLLLITITIIFFALLSLAIHALVSPPVQKYSTLEQLTDKPLVKKLAFIPFVAISGIALWWVVYYILKGPRIG